MWAQIQYQRINSPSFHSFYVPRLNFAYCIRTVQFVHFKIYTFFRLQVEWRKKENVLDGSVVSTFLDIHMVCQGRKYRPLRFIRLSAL